MGLTVTSQPSRPKELSSLDKIKNSLSIDSIEDAVSMSQRAYELSQVDWGNPSAALGALGGMAKRAGLPDLANGIGAVNTTMNTDWDDPASVLAAAGAMAKPLMKAGQAASDYFGGQEPAAVQPLQTQQPSDFANLSDLLNPPPEKNSSEMDRVEVHSNPLFGVADHTYIAVYKDGEVTTYAGRDREFSVGGILSGETHPLSIDRNNYNADLNNSSWHQEIIPPPGMSRSDFADSVIQAGDNAVWNSDTRDYNLLGGDHGLTSGNCHTTTNDIITDGGGQIPDSLDTPAIASPGLHGPPPPS